MNDSPSARLRSVIQDFLSETIDVVALWDGVFAMLPDLHAESAQVAAVADQIVTHLTDYDDGDTALADLHTALAAVAARLTWWHVRDEASASSSDVTLILEPPHWFQLRSADTTPAAEPWWQAVLR